MIYRFSYTGAALEFVKNQGRAFIEADDSQSAIAAVRDLFDHIREESVEDLGEEQFLVEFKVSLDYRLPLLRQVEKAVKMLRDPEMYNLARYIDRYCVASVFSERGAPKWLIDKEPSIRKEISFLRKSSVIAREVPNVRDFVDWDIVIYNYLELNSKEGFKSRVIRKVPH